MKIQYIHTIRTKSMKFIKTITRIIPIAIIAVSLSSHAAPDMKIGLLLPFSGVFTALGNDTENGFRLGIEKFSNNTKTEIIKADSEGNPSIGLSKAKKIIFQDKVDIMSGIVSSAVLGAVRNTIHNSKTPLVVANAGNIHATGKDCSPYIARVSFSNAQITRPMGDWMAKQGIKTAYVMASDYAAGHQMINAFRENFEKGGGKVIGETYPPLQGVTDYSSYLAVAKASGAEALFVFFPGSAAINFVKQYDDFGIAEDLPLYAAGFLTSPSYVQVQGKAADGIISSLHYLPDLPYEENTQFKQAYESRYNKPVSEFAVAGYDAARLIMEAWNKADGDKQAFVKNLSNTSFEGPRGKLSIDPKTHNVVQNIYILKNRWDGEKIVQELIETYPDRRDEANGCRL